MLNNSMQRRVDHEALCRAMVPDWTGKMIGPWPKVAMPFIFEPFRQYPGRLWHGNREANLFDIANGGDTEWFKEQWGLK